mmetsp:Transcript_42088/g.70022  ORF Transcript_42088/g.70022 Transcript_42088/m.70022 type:complete len:333 (+) Transcript_42088:39-1037(+)
MLLQLISATATIAASICSDVPAFVCHDWTVPCFRDESCLHVAHLGCNAGGVGVACRFCGSKSFPPCPESPSPQPPPLPLMPPPARPRPFVTLVPPLAPPKPPPKPPPMSSPPPPLTPLPSPVPSKASAFETQRLGVHDESKTLNNVSWTTGPRQIGAPAPLLPPTKPLTSIPSKTKPLASPKPYPLISSPVPYLSTEPSASLEPAYDLLLEGDEPNDSGGANDTFQKLLAAVHNSSELILQEEAMATLADISGLVLLLLAVFLTLLIICLPAACKTFTSYLAYSRTLGTEAEMEPVCVEIVPACNEIVSAPIASLRSSVVDKHHAVYMQNGF